MILAGGIGSRFWPVSTPDRPKQLLPLAGRGTLLAETVERILPLVPLERLRILTGAPLAQPTLAAVPQLRPENLLLEPVARGTAPVLAWAAAELVRRDPNAVLISLHADHLIEPAEAFRALLARAADAAARTGRLLTVGIEARRPETGYGYIRVGAPLEGEPGLFEVARFVEKPDRDTAESYLREGGYLWNSGIFIWRAATLLDELLRHTPELAPHLAMVEAGEISEFFEAVPTLSIDEGLLERSDRVAVVRAEFRWDDVGAWDAVGRTRVPDARGNVAVGEAELVDSDDCIAWAEDGPVVVFGARDLVVVRANGVTLVAPRERTAELKTLLASLPEHLRALGERGD